MNKKLNFVLLLIVAPSGLNILKYFSVRHSRQMFVTGLKLVVKASCLNLIENFMFLSCNFQICLNSQVAVLLALDSVLKCALWLIQRSFQLGSLRPV